MTIPDESNESTCEIPVVKIIAGFIVIFIVPLGDYVTRMGEKNRKIIEGLMKLQFKKNAFATV